MPSPLTPTRISAALAGALVGTATGIPLVVAAGMVPVTVSAPFAALAIGVPALSGLAVGAAVTPGSTRPKTR